MSNPIKYSTGSESLALKKGNFYIGTGDVGKGPTSTTGYYNGITPPTGGYTIYLNKESGGPSIYTVTSDTQLISLTNTIAGTSYTTVNECLIYFAGQTDKICVNRDYEPIVTDGLVLNLDAGFTPSYPKNGTTWYDMGGSNNGTLTNGPTFDTGGGGSIITDGIDDGIFINTFPNIPVKNSSFTVVFDDDIQSGGRRLFAQDSINTILWTKDVNNQYFRINNITQPTLPLPVQPPGVKYLTLTIDDNYLVKFYNRGNLITEQSFAGGAINYLWNSGAGAANLGYWTEGPSQFSKYKYYQLTLYSKTLSPEEVLQNYNAQKGRFGL